MREQLPPSSTIATSKIVSVPIVKKLKGTNQSVWSFVSGLMCIVYLNNRDTIVASTYYLI